MVGPVGFEPTTSAESVVYGYPHALPNLLISPIDGRRHTRHFILEPVMVPKRFPLQCHPWLDYGPSDRMSKARAPPRRTLKIPTIKMLAESMATGKLIL